jgi:alpha-1,2-rhamnosyltransferase
MSGIPRVVKSTHEFLETNLNIPFTQLFGFTELNQIPEFDNGMCESLRNDPLLNKKILKLKEVDLILLIDLNWDFVFELVLVEKKSRKLPVVSVIYDVIPLTHPQYFQEKYGAKAFLRNLRKKLQISDHLVFNSRATYTDFLKLGMQFSGECHIFPLGAFSLNSGVRHPIVPPNTILYVSTIEPRKGHEDVLNAFDELCNSGEDFRLILVGKHGWLCHDLVERIRSHPEYGKRLIWFDSITDEELRIVYAMSTVCVVPSRIEGFGLNLEEALGQRIPVVARDLPVFRERPYENVYFFDDVNFKMSEAIKFASNNKWQEIKTDLRPIEYFGRDIHGLLERLVQELRQEE